MKPLSCLLSLHEIIQQYQKPLMITTCRKCGYRNIKILSKEDCNFLGDSDIDDYGKLVKEIHELKKYADKSR